MTHPSMTRSSQVTTCANATRGTQPTHAGTSSSGKAGSGKSEDPIRAPKLSWSQCRRHFFTQACTHIHTLMCTDTKTHKRTRDASKTCHPSRAHPAHQTVHRCSRIHGEHILARDGPGLCIAVPLAQGDVSKEVHHLLPTQQAHTGLRRPVGCGVWWGGGGGAGASLRDKPHGRQWPHKDHEVSRFGDS
jgi:hypothetical protein